MQKRWILKQPDQATITEIMQHSGLSAVTASILASRGLTSPETCAGFLAPSLSQMHNPYLMAGMEQAVERLMLARNLQEKICIYGDYDVDGISATALLVSGLAEMGLQAGYHIPHRMEDGYGLNADALRKIKAEGYNLAITVDCGVTALEEARISKEIGLDLIITDHHQPHAELPDAVALIDPHRADCSYPFKTLSGVGVAFNLLVALRSRLREHNVWPDNGPDLRQFLDLVALGTIADLVPLVSQNRILTFAGLQRMGQGCRIGVDALKQVSGVKGMVSSGQVGFQLAPRLNAAGRLESAVPGVELLLSQNHEQAANLAQTLDAANQERRQVEQTILKQAISMVESGGGVENRHSIVLGSEDWHQGVVGIVASRLVDRYYRPTMLVALNADGSGKGSGRSISGLHLLDALHECSRYFERYGGHRAAAGISLLPGQFEQFASQFEAVAAGCLLPMDLIPELQLDAKVSGNELNLDLARELKQLEPFGMGNQTPLLMLENLQVTDQNIFAEQHRSVNFTLDGQSFRAVGWGMADQQLPDRVDLACTVKLDSWNGREQLKLEIKDFRAV